MRVDVEEVSGFLERVSVERWFERRARGDSTGTRKAREQTVREQYPTFQNTTNGKWIVPVGAEQWY